VRSEHAPAEQVLEALEMDIAKIQQALGRRRAARPAATPRPRSTRSTRSR
jgi:hypothetical protein